jgi:hypothetical protein
MSDASETIRLSLKAILRGWMNKYKIYALPSFAGDERWLWVLTYGLVVQATSSRWEDVVARFKMLTRRRPQ